MLALISAMAGRAPDLALGQAVQTCPAPPRAAGAPRLQPVAAGSGGCLARPRSSCLKRRAAPCAKDLELARIAWKYFENNYQPVTGFVNAANKYPSTTMWDLASSLAATIAAHQLGLIDDRTFDDRVMKMLAGLGTMPLYRDEAPNKVYNTAKLEMVDYANKPSQFGIGYSALDLARLGTWLDTLSCMYPRHAMSAQRVTHRWNYCRMVSDGQMYGAAFNKNTGEEALNQEGRLGYEQYGARNFTAMGFEVPVSKSYKNAFSSSIEVEGVRIPIDTRDPRKLGAFNYVVTESYALDAMEYGIDGELRPLINAIYEVQKRRWKRTGIVTAVSEDNVDRPPYFVYNTIYAAGSAWNTITDTGKDMEPLKSTSVKAAISLAVLFPDDPYSQVLFDKVATAYDPEKGWYSGVYEGALGYNTAITANTNGIILEALLYKMYGPLRPMCLRCGHSSELRPLEGETIATARRQCFPTARSCAQCAEPKKLTPLPSKPTAPPAASAAPGGAKAPAPGGAKAPAPGGAKAATPGGAKAATPGGAKAAAPGGAKAPAPGGAKAPAPGGAKPPTPGGAKTSAQKPVTASPAVKSAARAQAPVKPPW
jgi:Protein of unknown function (DUF3131)/Cornifin (SPRR) family